MKINPGESMKPRLYIKKRWIKNTNKYSLFLTYYNILTKAGLTIISSTDYTSISHAYSCLFFLPDSQLSIRTSPAAGKSYIELYTYSKSVYKQITI